MDTIKEAILQVCEKYRDKVIFAYLFGSAAKGGTSPLSDIDIAVFLSSVPGEPYFDAKLSLYADFCRALKRNDIDVIILNTTTNMMLLDEIVRHGIVVCDRDTDLREDFELKVMHKAIDFKQQRLAIVVI